MSDTTNIDVILNNATENISVDLMSDYSQYEAQANGLLDGSYSGAIKSDVTSLRYYALSQTNINSVDLPNVIEIPMNGISFCTSLTSVNIPKVTSVGIDAFNGCSQLTDVYAPNVETIKSGGFSYCNLHEVDFPKAISVGDNAFAYNKIEEINLPLVKTLGTGVFVYSDTLKKAVFPSLTSIGTQTFLYCTELEMVDLNVISTIANNTFAVCYELGVIVLRKTNGICTLARNTVLATTKFYYPEKGGTLYVPQNLIDAYKADSNWGGYFTENYPNNQILPIEGSPYEL